MIGCRFDLVGFRFFVYESNRRQGLQPLTGIVPRTSYIVLLFIFSA